MITVFSGEKGGTGKTTLASNFAIMRAIDNVDVLLVDADPQGSLSEFIRARDEQSIMPEINCMQAFGPNLHNEIRKFKHKSDDVIIDVGGKDSETLRSVLTIADVLIVPSSNSKLDFWAHKNFNLLVKEARAWNPSLKCFIVLNKADNIMDDPILLEDIKLLDQMNLMKATIGYRIDFRRAIAEGQAVVELKSKGDKKAIEEIKKLYQEIIENE